MFVVRFGMFCVYFDCACVLGFSEFFVFCGFGAISCFGLFCFCGCLVVTVTLYIREFCFVLL